MTSTLYNVHTSFDYLWGVFGVLYSWQYFRLASTPLTSSHSGRKNGDLLLHSGLLVVKMFFNSIKPNISSYPPALPTALGQFLKKRNKSFQRTGEAKELLKISCINFFFDAVLVLYGKSLSLYCTVHHC